MALSRWLLTRQMQGSGRGRRRPRIGAAAAAARIVALGAVTTRALTTRALARLALTGLAMMGLAMMGLAMARLAMTRLALTGLALTGLALTGLALTRLALTTRALARLAMTGLAVARLAMMGLAVAGLTACGGSSTPTTASSEGIGAITEPAGGCAPDEVRLAGQCWSARGTRWRVEASGPGGDYRFEMELMAAGRVRATDHEAASVARDEWVQQGPLLRVFLSDRFVEYRARLTNGTVLLGEAHNVRGQRWSFRAERIFEEPSCAEGEARLSGACMTLTGTRWRLSSDGEPPVLVELREGGQLGDGGQGADEGSVGRWEQRGEEVQLSVDSPQRSHVGRIVDADHLEGRWTAGEAPGAEGASGSWTATRVPQVFPEVNR